ncbi:MAG: hypothetical protein LUD80_01810, partial [Clostridiales bacterium]|nr:hypothetical protein [Clostridiales bacterium]
PGTAPVPAPSLPEPARPTPVYRYGFATSGGAASSFPFSTWARLSREVLSSRDQALLSAAHPQGVPELRQAIVRHLYQFRGIQVSPEQIVVGAGSEFLTALLVQLLGAKGGAMPWRTRDMARSPVFFTPAGRRYAPSLWTARG